MNRIAFPIAFALGVLLVGCSGSPSTTPTSTGTIGFHTTGGNGNGSGSTGASATTTTGATSTTSTGSTGSTATTSTSTTTTTTTGTTGSVTCAGGCSGSDVCVNGTCTPLPSSCPCPKESYCDLSSSSCKAGCLGDGDCAAHRICDADSRTCADGCRQDPDCGGGGLICQNLSCVTGCRADSACGVGKICTNDACVTGCHADSACGVGKICTNELCVTGCRTDGVCGSGKICVNTACRSGCRTDAQCSGSGAICDPGTLVCRSGCHAETDCPLGQLCGSSLTCVAGCTTDTRCPTGDICADGQCRPGCRAHTDCNLGSYCTADGGTCETGCAAPYSSQGIPSRCQVGEACVPMSNYARFECQQNCVGWTCNASTPQPFTCWYPYGSSGSGDVYSAQCRETCSANSDCPSGQICNYFTDNASVPGSYSRHFCSLPCTSDADCGNTVDSYGDVNAACACKPDGVCRYTDTYVCYQTSPGTLLPPVSP